MAAGPDDWWAGLDDDRKASIHRWLTGRVDDGAPLDGEQPLFDDAGEPMLDGAPC